MSTLTPPPADQPTGTTSVFPPPTGAQILRGLRAPLIGYLWLLLGAVVVMVLIVVAANVGSTGAETGVESDDTNALGVLLGMPFQVAAMALLGALHFTEDGVRASIFLPPLVLTALYLLMTARAARRGDPIPAAGTRALLGVIVGFAAAVVLTPATWALAMRAEGAAVHAASVSLFFGVWALTAVASYVGTSRAARAARPAWLQAEWVAAARLWLGSVAVWVVGAVVVLSVVAAVQGEWWLGILFPLWGLTAGLYSYAVAHLGALSLAGETADVGDLDAVWTVVVIVAALALAVLTSLAWHLRRDSRAASLAQPASWLVLPVTYAVGGLLVWLVPSVVVSGGISEFGGSATLQPAFWLVFVLVVWGAAVEAASRFVAPSLVPALPPRLRDVLRGPEPVTTVGAGAPVEAAESRPLTPEERARYKKMGIVAGVLAVVAIGGWITVSVVNSQFFGPEQQVEAYLDAVVDADLDEVNDLAPTDGDMADDALMTSDVYDAAESRITGYEIGDVEEDGDTVTAEVTLEGLGDSVDAELTLEKDGHTAVLFDRWRVTDGGLAKAVSVFVPDESEELAVNGVAVDRPDGEVWLLPGDYVFDAYAGNPWLESAGDPVTVVADEDYQFADLPYPTASDAFREEVQGQVDDYLADCMASTELEPENCPNTAYEYSEVRNVEWTLLQAPTPDFSRFDGTFPADLSYGDSGRARVTYEVDQSYGYGAPDWERQTEESDMYLSSVTVTEEDGDLVVTIEE